MTTKQSLLCAFFFLLSIQLFAQTQEDSTLYFRPQIHHTVERNYMGSPIAANYSDGVYNLYYEQNTESKEATNLTIGHATSTDLMHWQEQALDFDLGNAGNKSVGPGSIIVDKDNLLNLDGQSNTQVLFYASKDKGICLAYCTDKGHAWKQYSKPVLPYVDGEHIRDPKVFWYEPTKNYVMLVARNTGTTKVTEGVSFYTSNNLVDWTFRSHVLGLNGRPDFHELAVDGNKENMQWVLTDSVGNYMIGNFNGKAFAAMTSLMKNQAGTFHSPVGFEVREGDGTKRVIQIAAIGGDGLNGLAYAGVMSLPMELSLEENQNGAYLVKKPVAEFSNSKLKQVLSIKDKKIRPGLGENPLKKLKGQFMYVSMTLDLNNINSVSIIALNDRKGMGTELRYNKTTEVLSCLGNQLTLSPMDNKLKLDILVDHSTLDIIANDGKVVFSNQLKSSMEGDRFLMSPQGGELIIESLNAYTTPKRKK